MPPSTVPAACRALEHEAFAYETTRDFLEVALPFVAAGVAEREPVFIAAAGDCVAALGAELGPAPGDVTLRDTTEWAPHPATRLRAFHRLATQLTGAGARHLRLMGAPIWTSPIPEFRLEWARYESTLNAVLASFPATLICLYDAARLDPSVVADASRTHPEIRDTVGSGHSAAFEPPATLLPKWTAPAREPPPEAEILDAPHELGVARAWVIRLAEDAGLPAEGATDLGLAVTELVGNARLYAGGATRVACWLDDGRLVCQVDDEGPGITDPLADYRPPPVDGTAGRGLWLARQLADLVEILPRTPGTSVKLHMLLPGPAA